MEINPLNALNKRIVDILPPHFEKIVLPVHSSWAMNENIRRMKYWILKNLENRFFISESENSISTFTNPDASIVVGFEDHSEATYFSIAYQDNSTEEEPF
ncbi:MAG: hypothetical protein CMA64_10180 [Euryarchaeota archaeon]|jgi:hypothetical protein|nr:hypothetical protein [Euryarchaeota archaeon]